MGDVTKYIDLSRIESDIVDNEVRDCVSEAGQVKVELIVKTILLQKSQHYSSHMEHIC